MTMRRISTRLRLSSVIPVFVGCCLNARNIATLNIEQYRSSIMLCCKRLIGDFLQSQRRPWAFSWLKAATSAFTFKTLLRHYAKRALTPQLVDVKLGHRQRKDHKGLTVWLALSIIGVSGSFLRGGQQLHPAKIQSLPAKISSCQWGHVFCQAAVPTCPAKLFC